MAKEYVSIRIPQELADLIDNRIKRGLYGYSSRNEFVTESARNNLIELDRLAALMEKHRTESGLKGNA